MLVWRGPKIRRAYILFRLHNAWRDSSLWQTINHVHQSASHKLVIYMATFLTRFSPFFQYFRHFLVSARRKFGLAIATLSALNFIARGILCSESTRNTGSRH
jgi:hypothetical protein